MPTRTSSRGSRAFARERLRDFCHERVRQADDTVRAKKLSVLSIPGGDGRDISGREPAPLYSKAFMEVIALAIAAVRASAGRSWCRYRLRVSALWIVPANTPH
jgi:hypothetical protein